ncbi:MAG: ATP-grasp domain-containing protein [Hyphomicrobium sp.]|nr:ATP-grasp domain-containing protein [Hyphomicrobium sp.]
MTPTVVLTIGRLPKALDIARSFDHAGWRVIVAEPFARHLTGLSRSVAKSMTVTPPATSVERYLDDLVRVVRSEDARLVVPVSEETLYAAHLKNRLPSGVQVYGMAQDRILALHDKARFIETCRGHGLDVPETHRLGTPEARALAQRTATVVKHLYTCSGRGLRVLDAGADLPEPDPNDPAIVQEKLQGELYSTFSIAHEGRVLVTAVYRGLVMSGPVAVCFERVERPAVADWVAELILKEQWSGFISFDIFLDRDGRTRAIECNPRATSGIHFLETADIAPAMLDPTGVRRPRFRAQWKLQQFYPCLTETQMSLFRWGPYRQNVGHLFTARDVTWSARDPLPLLLLPYAASQIMIGAMRTGRSFGELSTEDISWRALGIAASGAPDT